MNFFKSQQKSLNYFYKHKKRTILKKIKKFKKIIPYIPNDLILKNL